ncbi:hypothetical protein LT343_27555 [Bacillus toyonensis]|uniref:hypothetical protein n=1 Tax=Bacillus toyonensis TaxID=155322 RepID=UPI001EE0CEB1|nr:hypothetical protein [Bacillus toyonensis]MCG3797052.1 hypothetical protein [Bacillus toyonensis]
MINLKDEKIKSYSPFYIKYMKGRVINLINNNSLSSANPFTGRPVKEFFTSNENDVDVFIKEILTEKISDLCEKYTEIKNYYFTSRLVFLSKFSVDIELKKLNMKRNDSNRQTYREKYVEKYNNPWIQHIMNNHSECLKNKEKFNCFIKDVERKLDQLNEEISKVIDYDLIEDDERHQILYNYGIEVCPYCNRNYISKYKKDGKLRTTADLDHFYPKSKFQLFSLSLYNFVPSCQICNSRFKLAKGVEIINPYTQKIDYTKFKFEYSLKPESTLGVFFNEENSFDVKINCTDTNYIQHINLFELENLYNTHKVIVGELLYKKEAYNNTYSELINNLFDEMNLTQSEKETFLFGIEMDEELFYKRPLSKLIFDIVRNN